MVGFSLDSLENVIDAVLGFGSLIGLWNFLAKSLCVTFTSLVPENFLECVCSGSYQLKKGLGGDLVCRLGNELCLIPAAKSQNALYVSLWDSILSICRASLMRYIFFTNAFLVVAQFLWSGFD